MSGNPNKPEPHSEQNWKVWTNFMKFSNNRFVNKNQFSGSRVVIYGQNEATRKIFATSLRMKQK